MTFICHHSITAVKILCTLPVHLSLNPLLAGTDLFIVSTVLTFPECLVVGIIQHVAFSDWILSVSNMHFRLLCVFSWLDS